MIDLDRALAPLPVGGSGKNSGACTSSAMDCAVKPCEFSEILLEPPDALELILIDVKTAVRPPTQFEPFAKPQTCTLMLGVETAKGHAEGDSVGHANS